MKKRDEDHDTVSDMSIDELRARVRQVHNLLLQILTLLPGLIHMSVPDRRRSKGKFRSGEIEAMRKLLVAAGKHPDVFAALADKDGGKDPKIFEAQPAIDDLERLVAIQEIAEAVELMAEKLGDTLLSIGAKARAVIGPVHGLITANREHHTRLAADAAEGMEFYDEKGRQAARTKARTRAKPEAPPPESDSE